ncbi:MAG: ribosome silencing factor [Steroidobacteraceae bacterium]
MSAARRSSRPAAIVEVVRGALDDMKAQDIRVLDVRGLTDITDYMIVASGSSDRHLRSIADNVVRQAREHGSRPFGVEGGDGGEWLLVDLPDAMVHIMLPRVRELYALERLWQPAAAPAAAVKPVARRSAARKPAARKASSGARARQGGRGMAPKGGGARRR